MSASAPRIDALQHHIPEFYKKALKGIGVHGSGENLWAKWSVEQALEVPDRKGIAATVSAVSSPGVYFGDVNFPIKLARDCNEYSAKMVADHSPWQKNAATRKQRDSVFLRQRSVGHLARGHAGLA